MRLSDVIKRERIGNRSFQIVPRREAKRVIDETTPFLRPYFIEVLNAAAGKREPMPRSEWEKLK